MPSITGRNVRVRGKWWHYQFEIKGQLISGNTALAGVESNRSAAEEIAERERQRLLNPHLASSAPIHLETDEERRRKPFDLAAAEFCQWAKDVEHRAKPATAQRLKVSMASCAAFFGDKPVSEIGAEAIEAYKQFRIQEHGVRDITLRHDLHALSVFFRKFAVKRSLAARNPLGRGVDGIREVSIPSDRDAIREHVITPEEEERYLAAALKMHANWTRGLGRKDGKPSLLPNLHDLSILMVETGARPEELCASPKTAVNQEAVTLRIGGGKTRAARRTLNLTPRSWAIVEPRLATAGPWLFPSPKDPKRHLTKWSATHDRICLEAGVSFVMYDWRHTFATRMIASGVDVPTVAAILGHSGLRTIFRYVHPTAEAQKQAMERFQAAQNRLKLKVVG